MKLIFVLSLALVSLATGELSVAPYPARGWKPNGPQFSLPQKQTPPSGTYGPPSTEITTTELPETTETTVTERESTKFEFQSEYITTASSKPSKPEKLEQLPSPNQVYIVVPQATQKLIYAAPLQVVTPVDLQSEERLKYQYPNIKPAPIQAIPALAKIELATTEEYPQYARVVQVQNFNAFPVTTYSQNTVLTPYSSSFVQIIQ